MKPFRFAMTLKTFLQSLGIVAITALAACTTEPGYIRHPEKHYYPARYDLPPGVTTVPFTLGIPLLSEPPTEPTMSQDEAVQFLDNNLAITKDVLSLPPIVLRSITESSEHLAIGPRGSRIPEGCTDWNTEYTSRLLFAGIKGDRGFIYFQTSGGSSGSIHTWCYFASIPNM